MEYRLVRFFYIDGVEIEEELGVYRHLGDINDIIRKSNDEVEKRLGMLASGDAREEECWVRYEIYPNNRIKLVTKLCDLISEKRHIEIHCPGNPPILDEEDIVIDSLSGVTRFYNEPNEFTISWGELKDADIDFLVDYIPELSS